MWVGSNKPASFNGVFKQTKHEGGGVFRACMAFKVVVHEKEALPLSTETLLILCKLTKLLTLPKLLSRNIMPTWKKKTVQRHFKSFYLNEEWFRTKKVLQSFESTKKKCSMAYHAWNLRINLQIWNYEITLDKIKEKRSCMKYENK